MEEDEGIPEERPWRKREYSGAWSTLGVAAMVVLVVGAAIWILEFRGETGGGFQDAGFGIVALDSALNPTGRPAAAEVGRAAPDFRLRMVDGGEVKLSDFRGKPVVVNFWASWCTPCRAEAPELEAVYVGNPDIVVLGVNQQETETAARKFHDEFAISYPLALDRSGEVTQAYRVPGLPITVLVDKNGIIVRMFSGGVTEKDLTDALRELGG